VKSFSSGDEFTPVANICVVAVLYMHPPQPLVESACTYIDAGAGCCC
jgi:hypothetical protein